MVESNNNMFNDSRGRAWCDVLDINLRKISNCIAMLRRRVSAGKHGLIPSKAEELKKMWDALEAITADVVERHHYKYDEERGLLQRTIMPVSVCRLCPDSDTLPPRELKKNSAGRPKNDNQIRNCSVHDAEDSPIVCSLCGGRGHNKRTCAPRQ